MSPHTPPPDHAAPHALPLPRAPRLASALMRPLPLRPLSLALTRLTRLLSDRHPAMLRRMGEYAGRRFLLDPVDLPFVLLLEPALARVTACRRVPDHDVRITGPLSGFLAMVHAEQDGDALFFMREVTVAGDTAAALALRNAVDDAELDLSGDIAALAGRAGPVLTRATTWAERLTGLTLHRHEAGGYAP